MNSCEITPMNDKPTRSPLDEVTAADALDARPRHGLLMFMARIDPKDDAEFNRWYREEHIPERTRCKGFRSARRFRTTDGSNTYLALYELDSPAVLDGPDYQAIEGPTKWTQEIRKLYLSSQRHVFVEITDDEPAALWPAQR